MKFNKIRKDCLEYWLENTKRKRYINDINYETYECYWQNNYVSTNMHNSFFCSLGEWNTHITDILSDKSLDKYVYSAKRYRSAIFRYYTRYLLIVSEILTDFQDFINYLEPDMKIKQIRTKLSDKSHAFSFDELLAYINTVCKHKVDSKTFKKYHNLNHHINYFFLDSHESNPASTINIKNISSSTLKDINYLEIPKLSDITYQILFAYSIIDNYLANDYDKLKDKLHKFEGTE